MRAHSRWHSPRLERDVTLARWGHWGQPVLLFPTAGGDAFEMERMHVIDVLMPLIEGGRIKVFSCDSVAGQAWVSMRAGPGHCCWLQNRFGAFVAEEVVPAIRADCRSDGIEVITAGASIGAFNAVASLCRFPWLFSAALGMSGTYDLEQLFGFRATDDFYFASPLLFLAVGPAPAGAAAPALCPADARAGAVGGAEPILAHGRRAGRQGGAEPGRAVGTRVGP